MTRPKKPRQPEILNPLYEGATPGMVAKALMRPAKEAEQEGDGNKPEKATEPPARQSSI